MNNFYMSVDMWRYLHEPGYTKLLLVIFTKYRIVKHKSFLDQRVHPTPLQNYQNIVLNNFVINTYFNSLVHPSS